MLCHTAGCWYGKLYVCNKTCQKLQHLLEQLESSCSLTQKNAFCLWQPNPEQEAIIDSDISQITAYDAQEHKSCMQAARDFKAHLAAPLLCEKPHP